MIEIGQKVQVWGDEQSICLGWGMIIRISIRESDKVGIPLIELESGRKVWGNQVFWITDRKAAEIGARIFKNTMKGEEK